MTDKTIDAYLARVGGYLSALPAGERDEIIAELSSHLRESLAANPDGLAATFKGLGSPEDFARGYLDDDALRAALAGGTPTDMLMGVLRQAPHSLGAFTGFAVVSVFYLFAFSFFGLIVLELINPEQTGLWIGGDMNPFFLGMISGSGPSDDLRDVAGLWFIPLSLALASLSTIIGMTMARWFAKLLLKQHN